MILLISIAALAGAPEVVVGKDGGVVGVADLAVRPDVIQRHLSDPTWLPTVDGGGTTVVLDGMDGSCQLLTSTSPSSVMTVEYKTRRCPTKTGFKSTLRESNAFKSYTTSWTFEPTPTGTRATYRIDANSSLWVPEAIVRRQTRIGIERMLTNVQAWSVKQAGSK